MVVRINQLESAGSPECAGWPVHDFLGPIRFRWRPDSRLYEVLILPHDESRRALADDFRQAQLRKLIPSAVDALREPGEQIVVRLDGAFRLHELAAAFELLAMMPGPGRFATSPTRKLEAAPRDTMASVRFHAPIRVLEALCANEDLGLPRSVRLRAFAAAEALVNPLLDIDAVDDERWEELAPQCGFILTTTRGLRSLQVMTRRLEPAAIRARLTRHLLGSSGKELKAAPTSRPAAG